MASFQTKAFTPAELEEILARDEVFYDQIELEDMKYDEKSASFKFPCPCGDDFIIQYEDLLIGEDKAICPSCSLVIRVSYDQDALKNISEIYNLEYDTL